jgi:large subunit ribosomal protein L31
LDRKKNNIIFAVQKKQIIKRLYEKGYSPKNYRLVVFKDMSNEHIFITKSTAASKETIDIDGVTYPLIKVEISNTSHPFYTGKVKLVDTAGRVDRFRNRYQNITIIRSNSDIKAYKKKSGAKKFRFFY